jgi:hypothetical protein
MHDHTVIPTRPAPACQSLMVVAQVIQRNDVPLLGGAKDAPHG